LKKFLDADKTVLNPLWSTSDPDLIELLINKFYPCNYGIYTPGMDIVVIDTDNKQLIVNGKPLYDGLTGVQLFYLLANQHPEILNTVRVLTPSKGIHYYYAVPDGYTIRGFNSTEALKRSKGMLPIIPAWFNMDVRAQRSYGIIAIPPSSKNGVKYEYIGERTLLNTSADKLPVLPDILLDIFKQMGYARRSHYGN
jgi:hypothetical protein